jgi:RIO kinase 1
MKAICRSEDNMSNDPYLDASVAWRIRSGNIEFRDADYRTMVQSILGSGLATEMVSIISTGKEADVYLARYNGAPLAVKVYRLYRTSHKGGGPIKLENTSWLAAHEFDMLLMGWRGGVRVPTPARRVENMLSMRYLVDGQGHSPKLQEVELEDPKAFLEKVLSGLVTLADAGVVHTDLSAFNILVHEGEPWFIDLSEAVRVDRFGYSHWKRLTEASIALERGLASLQKYFGRYGLEIDVDPFVDRVIRSMDRFGVLPEGER